MQPIIYPYSMASRSARSLARSLNTRRVYPDRTYHPRPNHLIINWGSSTVPNWREHMSSSQYLFNVLNNPVNVAIASNKRNSLIAMLTSRKVTIPKFTENCHEAYEWNTPVMVRSLLRSHSGRGASFVSKDDRELLIGSLASAPLYVEYIKKAKEYRVHVFRGEVKSIQEKRLRHGSTGNDFQIRSYSNGWVFCRDNVSISDDGIALATAAISALGLDFGAVDIIYNSHHDKYYVLEVNTAPGLYGETLAIYANSIKEIL